MRVGNEYKAWGMVLPNSSPLFWLLQNPSEEIQPFLLDDVTPIHETLERLEEDKEALRQAYPLHKDARLIQEEIDLTISLLQHACRRALWLSDQKNQPTSLQLRYEIEEIIFRYRSLWLKRNRPGGLQDSLSYFNHLLDEYGSI